MDEINEKPNVTFPFTVVNANKFRKTDVKKIITSKTYCIPDYWFNSNEGLLEFSKTLKFSKYFLDYFYKILKHIIDKKYDSFIVMTLRTNQSIVFVKVDSGSYLQTIENLIEMNINLEEYEQCQRLTELKKELLNSFSPIVGKNFYYESYEFWSPVYPNKL